MKLICKKNIFWWKFSFQTIIFGSFYPTKCQLSQLRVFSKTNNCLRKWKKTVFLSRLLKRIKFWNQFFTASQIRIKFFKMEQSFVQLYTTRQLLYRKIYSVSEFKTSYSPHIRFGTEILTTQQIFEWNWFRSINLSWTICFQKIIFFVNLYR